MKTMKTMKTMKHYYAIMTDFHGKKSIARFDSKASRDQFCIEYGAARWDTGQKSVVAVAVAVPAGDSRVRMAIRESFWSVGDYFEVRNPDGEVKDAIAFEIAI